MGSDELLDFSFNACPTRLKEVRPQVREAAVRAGFTEDQADQLVLVVDEAVANVIRHGYHGDREGPIHLLIAVDDDRLVIRLRDQAEPVDASCIRPRDLSECRPGGLGINFIDSVMDSWEFRCPEEGEGNILEMTKTIARGRQ